MSCDQRYPLPQVYLVDGGGGVQHSGQPPSLIPCWSFPPAQERVRSPGKSRGIMGVSPCLALVVLMMFLLVFAALGFEAYQIYTIQAEMREMKQVEPASEFRTEKQIGGYEPERVAETKTTRTAAHMIGRIENNKISRTLRWDPSVAHAFISGDVKYLVEDGGLQVNKSGLYHIFTRVELIFRSCPHPRTFFHEVFVRRAGSIEPVTLMKAHKEGFCSQQSGNAWTTESYLGSTVKLQQNDRVYVNVSHPEFLSHTHYVNFFGLHKI